MSLLRPAVSLLVLALAAAPVFSHELGTVQVRAEFLRDGTYRVDLLVDTEQIPSAPAARFPAADAALATWRPQDRERVESFLARLFSESSFTFDGAPIAPTVTI